MEFKRNFKISTIIFIQNLRSGDLKTGLNLYEDLLLQSAILEKKEIRLEFYEPSDKNEFIKLLRGISSRCHSEGLIPWLHLDIHGFRRGLVFGEQEDVLSWKEIRRELTLINQVTGFNLFISLAVCYGAWILSELLEIGKPAPYMGFIGSQTKESAGEISKIFSAFYLNFLETWNISVSHKLIQKKFSLTGFRVYFSEVLFYESYALYLRRGLTHKSLSKRWTEAVQREHIRGNAKLLRKKRQRYLKMLVDDGTNRSHFDEAKNTFFSVRNINEEFLSVTYEKIKKFSKSLKRK